MVSPRSYLSVLYNEMYLFVMNAVLFHTGYYSPSATPPPNSIAELRATIRILESQKSTYIFLRVLGNYINYMLTCIEMTLIWN